MIHGRRPGPPAPISAPNPGQETGSRPAGAPAGGASFCDQRLEQRIEAAEVVFVLRPTRENWYRLADLIASRSHEQVARMERQKGLR